MPRKTDREREALRRFGEVIKAARMHRKFTQDQVGTRIDRDFTYISKLEKGAATIPSEAVLEGLSKMLALDIDELRSILAPAAIGDRFEKFVSMDRPSPSEGRFPKVGLAAAGAFIEAIVDNRAPHGGLRATAPWKEALDELDSNSHIAAAFVVQAEGDSMLETIRDGDEVLIDPKAELDPNAKPPQIALVRVNGEVTIKRWQVKGDEIVLTPDNPDRKKFDVMKLSKKKFAAGNGIAWRAVLTRTTRKL